MLPEEGQKECPKHLLFVLLNFILWSKGKDVKRDNVFKGRVVQLLKQSINDEGNIFLLEHSGNSQTQTFCFVSYVFWAGIVCQKDILSIRKRHT